MITAPVNRPRGCPSRRWEPLQRARRQRQTKTYERGREVGAEINVSFDGHRGRPLPFESRCGGCQRVLTDGDHVNDAAVVGADPRFGGASVYRGRRVGPEDLHKPDDRREE